MSIFTFNPSPSPNIASPTVAHASPHRRPRFPPPSPTATVAHPHCRPRLPSHRPRLSPTLGGEVWRDGLGAGEGVVTHSLWGVEGCVVSSTHPSLSCTDLLSSLAPTPHAWQVVVRLWSRVFGAQPGQRVQAGSKECSAAGGGPPSPFHLPLSHSLPHANPAPPFHPSTFPLVPSRTFSSHPPIISSAHPLIRPSSHPPIISSAHHLIRPSSHPPIISSAHPLTVCHASSFMPAKQEQEPPWGPRNGLSVLGVLPKLGDSYAVPIAQPPRDASPVRSVGYVFAVDRPNSPTADEPHPSLVLVPGGDEGSSRPSTASPSTVNSTPGKRPRIGVKYTQQRLWGAPPPKKDASPTRTEASADPKPPTVTAEAEYAAYKHRYDTEWAGKFDWLRLHHQTNGRPLLKCKIDVTLVAHIVEQTRMRLKARYLSSAPGHTFGSGEYMTLPDFYLKHQKQDKREMKVEGVDSNGDPVSFKFLLHERPLKGLETDGDVTTCYELSVKFVRAIDKELEWRMRDLANLEGTKLFRTVSYITDDAKRVEAFKRWLGLLHKLYHGKLPGER
ncbi:unnamed protein product [Closterium sp. NIES-64]|nr:unnamed protein product [Closterium sp. NIES-64]